MSPHESTVNQQTLDELRGLRADLRVLHTKLFGEDDEENSQGRIPRIEAALVDHSRRLKRQERRTLLQQGAAALAGAIVTAAMFIYHLVSIAKGH